MIFINPIISQARSHINIAACLQPARRHERRTGKRQTCKAGTWDLWVTWQGSVGCRYLSAQSISPWPAAQRRVTLCTFHPMLTPLWLLTPLPPEASDTLIRQFSDPVTQYWLSFLALAEPLHLVPMAQGSLKLSPPFPVLPLSFWCLIPADSFLLLFSHCLWSNIPWSQARG